MPTHATNQQSIIRTERGATVSGTRITIYDVMDYVTAGWPPHLIRDRLQLTDAQVADALAYIEANRAEVEREYEAILQTAAENRRYWEERNKHRFPRVREAPLEPSSSSPSSPSPDNAELRAKLQEWKARRGVP